VNQFVELLPPLTDAVDRLPHLYDLACPLQLLLFAEFEEGLYLLEIGNVKLGRLAKCLGRVGKQLNHCLHCWNHLLLFLRLLEVLA
jgi:hypothetical protein